MHCSLLSWRTWWIWLPLSSVLCHGLVSRATNNVPAHSQCWSNDDKDAMQFKHLEQQYVDPSTIQAAPQHFLSTHHLNIVTLLPLILQNPSISNPLVPWIWSVLSMAFGNRKADIEEMLPESVAIQTQRIRRTLRQTFPNVSPQLIPAY